MSAATVVRHLGGLRFGADVRSHIVHTDQPIKGGGSGSAPSPVDLLGAALGSCIGLYVYQFCVTRHLAVEGMRVEVDQKSAVNLSRVAEFRVLVVLPEPLPPQYEAVLDRVVRGCPVYNTLACGATIHVDVTDLSANSSESFRELADCHGR